MSHDIIFVLYDVCKYSILAKLYHSMVIVYGNYYVRGVSVETWRHGYMTKGRNVKHGTTGDLE